MKTYFIQLLLFVLIFSSCATSTSSSQNALEPKEFEKEMHATAGILIDVRTAQEFAGGHIDGAINIDWNSSEFSNQIKPYQKDQRLYIYCLSGGRSHAAAESLRSEGYSNIIEMNGGILKWQNEGLPLATASQTSKTGMSTDEFESKLSLEKYTIVDFNAAWCAPCKKLKPLLENYVKQNPNVQLLEIDVDSNPELVASFAIDAIPRILVYKGNKLINDKKGLLTNDEVLKLIP